MNTKISDPRYSDAVNSLYDSSCNKISQDHSIVHPSKFSLLPLCITILCNNWREFNDNWNLKAESESVST